MVGGILVGMDDDRVEEIMRRFDRIAEKGERLESPGELEDEA